jgi:hypothetical protein
MIPENGVFTFISHVTLSTTATTIPLGTTHILVSSGTTGALLQDENGILGFKVNSGASNQILGIPCGEFVRLFTNLTPGTSLLFKTTAVGGVVPNIDQVTFYKWEII